MPHIKSINLRFAGQLKTEAFNYMVEKCENVKRLRLGATNLVSDDSWRELFRQQGSSLEILQLSELNDSFRDETVEEMAIHCTQLRRLKLRTCLHTTEASLNFIAEMRSLEHLTLGIGQSAPSEILVGLIRSLGPNLRTLCLENYANADDDVLRAIKAHCASLSKLRVTGSAICSDRGFATLFKDWSNPPILFVDLSDNRDMDNANPEGPRDEPIGLGPEGFKALMKHSGSLLERINLHSCRHITHGAFSTVFDGHTQYAHLKDIDVSFVTGVDDFTMTSIFRSCPRLSKLAAFACFKARDVRIPAGVAVIGLPNAQDAVIVEGDVVGDP